MSGPWINYTLVGGYDPNDGLDETTGRWMRDTWGVVVWVVTADKQKEADAA